MKPLIVSFVAYTTKRTREAEEMLTTRPCPVDHPLSHETPSEHLQRCPPSALHTLARSFFKRHPSADVAHISPCSTDSRHPQLDPPFLHLRRHRRSRNHNPGRISTRSLEHYVDIYQAAGWHSRPMSTYLLISCILRPSAFIQPAGFEVTYIHHELIVGHCASDRLTVQF